MNSLFTHYTAIDLTHTIDPTIPTWDSCCGFSSTNIWDYADGLRVQKYTMNAGIGTHIDAPAHFVENGADVADLPFEKLFAPLHVIDVSAHADADYAISITDIQNYEKKYGTIQPKSFVAAFTGWSLHWSSANYRNIDAQDIMHFPKFSPEAVNSLLKQGIVGIGIDTLSPDGNDMTFPVHHLVLKANRYIVENMANLEKMPSIGGYILTLPLPIKGGTESPVRIFGFIKK